MPLVDYHTIVAKRGASESFSPTTSGNPGRLDVSYYGPKGDPLLYVPRMIVAWNMNDIRTAVPNVTIEFVDPDDENSRVVLEDWQTSPAAMTSLVTPGNGLGHPVPLRPGSGKYYELHVTTSSDPAVGQRLTVQLWWEPRRKSDIEDALRCYGPEAVRQLAKLGSAVRVGNVSPGPGVFEGRDGGGGSFTG